MAVQGKRRWESDHGGAVQEVDIGGLLHLQLVWRKESAGERERKVKGFCCGALCVCMHMCLYVHMHKYVQVQAHVCVHVEI